MTDFRPQLAVAFKPKDTKKLSFPLIAEPKLDGVRCVCVIKDGVPTFWSRDGKPFVNFSELEQEIISLLSKPTYPSIDALRNCILDGEILSLSRSFDDTISRTRSHRGVNTHIDYNYHVFDVLINPEPLGTVYPLEKRKEHLTWVFGLGTKCRIKILPHYVVNTIGQMFDVHDIYCSAGHEGTMIKPSNSLYHQGRNQDWKKIKPFHSADLRITGMTAGTGKCAGMMGRIMVQGRIEDIEAISNGNDPCESFYHVQCEVGTGFTDELRKDMWNNIESYIGRYVEIQYQEITKNGALRFPSFKRFRKDKDNV